MPFLCPASLKWPSNAYRHGGETRYLIGKQGTERFPIKIKHELISNFINLAVAHTVLKLPFA